MKITHAQLFSSNKPFPLQNPAQIYHHQPRETTRLLLLLDIG